MYYYYYYLWLSNDFVISNLFSPFWVWSRLKGVFILNKKDTSNKELSHGKVFNFLIKNSKD